MSTISHYLRGYRNALRELRLAVILLSLRETHEGGVSSAVHTAGEDLSIELRKLKCLRSEAIKPDLSCHSRLTIRSIRAEYARMFKIEYFHGYLAGVDRAHYLTHRHGMRMNYEPSRIAVLAAADTISRFRASLDAACPDSARILKRRKYVLG